MAKTERGQRAYEDRHERAADELVGDLLIDVEVEVANGIHERLAAGIAALEQACAVPAVAGRGGETRARVDLAESIVGVVLGGLAERGAIDAACATWGASIHREIRRELTGKVADALAEAGKAQAEGWHRIPELPLPKTEGAEFDLPDSDVWVLAATEDGSDVTMVRLEFTDDSDGHGEPYWESVGGDLALCNYPWWMPIPALPSPPASQLPAGETER
jgi:hypothetical protein